MSKSLLKLIVIVITFMVMLPSLGIAQYVNTVVSLTGSILDAVSREPVSAIIYIEDETGKRINASKSNASEKGYYYLTGLKPGEKYFVNIRKQNYFDDKFEFFVPNTDKYKEISKDFLVKPKEKDAKIPMIVPPFELNKSKLRFGVEDFLTEIIGTLLNNPKVKFEIQCFPDNDDNPSENKELTTNRCKSLQSYFTQKGITTDRMTIAGHNNTDPQNPPPKKSQSKGKRYIGTTYIVVKDF